MDNVALLQCFSRQFGVASRRQIVQLGVSARTVRRACERGVIVPVVAGVFRQADSPITFEMRAMAVLLRCGPGAYLTATTAAALHGMRSMPRERIHVAVPRRTRADLPRWVVVTTAHDPRDAFTRKDGLRLARPLPTLMALAAQFNDHRFERAAEDAWHLELITPRAAAEFLDGCRGTGRRGLGRFERWIAKTRPRSRASRSAFELDVLDAIRSVGLPEPERQVPVVLTTGEVVHVDLAWPAIKFAVEPGHSWWHGGDLGVQRDQARDRACGEVGWAVARYEEAALKDLDAVGHELARLHAERLALFQVARNGQI